MTGGPILIPCEGSGGSGILLPAGRMCQMCGRQFPEIEPRPIPDHTRDDILARLDRGDFG